MTQSNNNIESANIESANIENANIKSTNTKSTNIKSANRKSARQLVISENSPLDMRENPNTGKYFFVCGSKKGYISPAAQKALMEGKPIDEFQYAEVSINGGAAVPCLMVVGNSNANLKVRLGEELLH